MPSSRMNIMRLRGYAEGTYGTDATASLGSFFEIKSEAAAPSLADARLTDERIKQRLFDKPMDYFGFRSSKLSVKNSLVSTGTALTNSATYAATQLSQLLDILTGYGKNTPGPGSLVASGASATGVTVTATHGSRFAIGTLISLTDAAGNAYVRKIKSISVDALGWDKALPFTPAVGSAVVNSETFVPGTGAPSLQVLYEGENRNDIWLLLGGQGSLSIEWVLGQAPKYSVDLEFPKYLHDDDIASPQGGSALASATYDGAGLQVAGNGGIYFAPMTPTTLVQPKIDKVDISLGMKWLREEALNGIEGQSGWMLMPETPTVTLELPFDDESYWDARAARTKYSLMLQAGTVHGSVVAVEFPCLQIVDTSEAVDRNGLRYQKLVCQALEDENASDKSTIYRRAPWRIGRL